MMHDGMCDPGLAPTADQRRLAAVSVARRLRDAGHVAYFAGGCVRDHLLGREPADYDIATDALPEKVRRLFRRTRAVGEHFGVVLVLVRPPTTASTGPAPQAAHLPEVMDVPEVMVEVATFRMDGTYADGRRPDGVTFSTAEQDALRRDFTINGMFMDPVSGEVIDFVGGRADLDARVLRAIGEPARRFSEDHLRLIRAVRFACRFDLAIEPQTWSAMVDASGCISGVSPERVLEELSKIAALSADRRARAIDLLVGCRLAGPVLRQEPDLLAAAAGDAVQQQRNLPDASPLPLVLAGWLSTLRRPWKALPTPQAATALSAQGQQLCRQLHASNRLSDSVRFLLLHEADLAQAQELATLRQLRAAPDWPMLRELALCRCRCGCDDNAELVARQIAVAERYPSAAAAMPPPLLSGDALMAEGVCKPGRELGELLRTLYRAQLNESWTDPQQAWALVRNRQADIPQSLPTPSPGGDAHG